MKKIFFAVKLDYFMSKTYCLNYINNVSEVKFMKIIDLAHAIREANEQNNQIQNNINEINGEINNLQKKINSNDKIIIINKIKELGINKKNIILELDLMIKSINGLREKLSRLGPDRPYDKYFIDYIMIILDNHKIVNKFIDKMNTNYNLVYLSDYAKKLAKETNLNVNSDIIFYKLSSLLSFNRRNLLVAQKVFQEDLISENIQKFLGDNKYLDNINV